MKETGKKNVPINFEEAFKSKRILYGIVKIAQRGEFEDEEDSIIVECGEVLITIPESECVVQSSRASLVSLIGVQIPFIVTSYTPSPTEGGKPIMLGSQERAVKAIIKPLLKKLKAGETITTVVSNIQIYGAYVTAGKGYLSMLLKNADFSEDTTRCCDILEKGDKIRVKFVKETATGTIICKAETPYKGKNQATDLNTYSPGQVVGGVVVGVKPYGAYVSISTNLDMLVNLPASAELIEGMRVSCKIKKIVPEEGRIRGKIINILY